MRRIIHFVKKTDILSIFYSVSTNKIVVIVPYICILGIRTGNHLIIIKTRGRSSSISTSSARTIIGITITTVMRGVFS